MKKLLVLVLLFLTVGCGKNPTGPEETGGPKLSAIPQGVVITYTLYSTAKYSNVTYVGDGGKSSTTLFCNGGSLAVFSPATSDGVHFFASASAIAKVGAVDSTVKISAQWNDGVNRFWKDVKTNSGHFGEGQANSLSVNFGIKNGEIILN